MSKINIEVKNGWNYCFSTSDYENFVRRNKPCPICGSTTLSGIYCYIIDSLKEAGLLHEDFEETCCCCLVLKKFGLTELRDRLKGFYHHTTGDCLVIRFYNGIMYDDDVVRIHDWSKIELF